MGFGGSKVPEAEPVKPVPQDDDPRLLDSQRKAAAAARTRDTTRSHSLVSSGHSTDTAGGKPRPQARLTKVG